MSLVSVIIPCYNYGWSLPETLESVIAQTYTEWECLIVDDGSTDSTLEVAERYQAKDSRFRYIHQHNQGVSAARNRGMAEARGEFIQFLDADDLLSPQKLASGVNCFTMHPTVDLVYGDVRYFRDDENRVLSRSYNLLDEEWMVDATGKGEAVVNKMIESSFIIISGPLFRAALIKIVGNFAQEIPCVEDWHFWMRCAIAGAEFRYDSSPAAWTLVRLHPTSVSQNTVRMAYYESVVRKQLIPLLERIGAKQALAINNKAIIKITNIISCYNLQKGDMIKGVVGYLQLAQRTGEYRHYLKSIAYWLKLRYVSK